MSISLVTKTIRFITVKIGPNEVIVIVEKGRTGVGIHSNAGHLRRCNTKIMIQIRGGVTKSSDPNKIKSDLSAQENPLNHELQND